MDVSDAPMREAIKRTFRLPGIATIVPSNNAIAKPVAAISFTFFKFPAPNKRERQLPDPCPQKNPIAWMIAMTEKTMPTAAVASVEIRPTNYVSAEL